MNAQLISFGVTGGFPFNDVVKNETPFGSIPASGNYTVGPSVQVNLRAKLSS